MLCTIILLRKGIILLKNKIHEWLKNNLSNENYEHSLRTAQTAVELAKIHNLNSSKAEIAGLVHDVAKELTDEQLIAEAKKRGLQLNWVELKKPYLIHAKIGAEIAREIFHLEDVEVLQAISNHTYGRTNMTPFEKLIYVADVIEPGRRFKGLDVIRKQAKISLEQAFALAYQGQLTFLLSEGKLLHPATLNVWNELVAQGRLP